MKKGTPTKRLNLKDISAAKHGDIQPTSLGHIKGGGSGVVVEDILL